MDALPWLVVPAAYLLGGVSPGYWLVRRRTGADLRTQGSGATGATNAARVLGRGAFVTVLALDAIKGALACLGARWAGLGDTGAFATAAAVVAGHIWPLQLGFRGGRGLGPLLGAWLVLAPLAIGACLAFAGLWWAASRRKVQAGLLGTLLLPGATAWTTRSLPTAALTVLTVALILLAHRSHWRSRRGSPTDA